MKRFLISIYFIISFLLSQGLPTGSMRETAAICDSLVENNQLKEASQLVHQALNIYLLSLTSEDITKTDLHYLGASVTDLYLKSGLSEEAVDWANIVVQFCHRTGRIYTDPFIRTGLNSAGMLIYHGFYEQAAASFTESFSILQEISPEQISCHTLYSLVRNARILVGYVDEDFFAPICKFASKFKEKDEKLDFLLKLLNCRINSYYHHYEGSYQLYEPLFRKAYWMDEVALTDALEAAWHYDKKEYKERLMWTRHMLLKIILENMNVFPISTTENYWNKSAFTLNRVFGLGLNNMSTNQDVLQEAYINSVFTKSLSRQNHSAIWHHVRSTGTPEMKSVLSEILSLKQRMANTSNDSEFESLRYRLDQQETALRGSVNLRQKIGWSENRTIAAASGLNDDECVVEILQYHQIGENGSTIYRYGAIVGYPVETSMLGLPVRKAWFDFVDLGPTMAWQLLYGGLNGEMSLQKKVDNYRPGEMLSIALLSKPLIDYLRAGCFKKAYVSPTGLLSGFNFGALPIDEEGQILNDLVEIVQIFDTFDVYEISHSNTFLRNGTTFCNIAYNANPEKTEGITDELSETQGYHLPKIKGGNFKKFYPVDIDKDALMTVIDKNVKKNILLTDANASEKAFKLLDGHCSDLLHIDTHGYYISDEENQFIDSRRIKNTREKSLITSGLILAGANRVWSGQEVPEGEEDGILTAWEISCMDLRGCKLAVLSACETASGDNDPLNGVLGLQRALKIAGVKSMLLTLWPVDNDLTQEFINSFYDNLPGSKNFNEAFVKTQRTFRHRHPDPYIWAPFILIN